MSLAAMFPEARARASVRDLGGRLDRLAGEMAELLAQLDLTADGLSTSDQAAVRQLAVAYLSDLGTKIGAMAMARIAALRGSA